MFLIGLFETSHLKYYDERKDSKDPTLENMVEKAIKLLRKNDKGYFLFVEGSKILPIVVSRNKVVNRKTFLSWLSRFYRNGK